MSPKPTKPIVSLTDLPAAIPNGMPTWMHQMREAAQACIKREDIEAIVRGQVERAKEGDRGAIRFVFDQILGGATFRGATFVQNNIETCFAGDSLTGAVDPKKPIRQGASGEERLAITKARLAAGLPLTRADDSSDRSLD